MSVLDSSFVPVAVAERSGFDESVHLGAVVALDERGRVAWSAGDPEVAIYPRSSLKPIQAAAMTVLGLDVPGPLLALVCASHDGCPEHVAGVRTLLEGGGRVESDLANTPALPINEGAASDVVRAGGGPAAILHNCSGKHAGMVVVAAGNGWEVEHYLDPHHPVQEAILDHVEATAGTVSHVGVDGCGAPTPVVSLLGLARAMRDLAVSGHAAYRAMVDHPELVGGPTRDVTRLMQAVPGLMAKDGAEGVYVAALPDGRTVALKIADGANRARVPVMLAALAALEVDVPSASLVEPVMGHGRPVGTVRSLVGAA